MAGQELSAILLLFVASLFSFDNVDSYHVGYHHERSTIGSADLYSGYGGAYYGYYEPPPPPEENYYMPRPLATGGSYWPPKNYRYGYGYRGYRAPLYKGYGRRYYGYREECCCNQWNCY